MTFPQSQPEPVQSHPEPVLRRQDDQPHFTTTPGNAIRLVVPGSVSQAEFGLFEGSTAPGHSDDDITRSVDVNLTGAVRLTATLLPLLLDQGFGTVVHSGGFLDGRLALPYHSVDVATRAGLAAFAESVNRELAPTRVRVVFFSPNAADTAAERPYHTCGGASASGSTPRGRSRPRWNVRSTGPGPGSSWADRSPGRSLP